MRDETPQSRFFLKLGLRAHLLALYVPFKVKLSLELMPWWIFVICFLFYFWGFVCKCVLRFKLRPHWQRSMKSTLREKNFLWSIEWNPQSEWRADLVQVRLVNEEPSSRKVQSRRARKVHFEPLLGHKWNNYSFEDFPSFLSFLSSLPYSFFFFEK